MSDSQDDFEWPPPELADDRNLWLLDTTVDWHTPKYREDTVRAGRAKPPATPLEIAAPDVSAIDMAAISDAALRRAPRPHPTSVTSTPVLAQAMAAAIEEESIALPCSPAKPTAQR